MILSIGLLLLVEIGSSFRVSSNEDGRNFEDNAIINESTNGRSNNYLFPRDSSFLNSTESSIRASYERAMNRTITDYYAKRKAVMERYYTRQREIVDKFEKKRTTTQRTTQLPRDTTIDSTKLRIIDDDQTTIRAIIQSTTDGRKFVDNEKIDNVTESLVKLKYGDTMSEGEKNSSVSLDYRSNNWNPKNLEDDADMDFQAESSNPVARRLDKTEVPGYYRLGEFKGSKDEKIVYQHNLGVGLKGSSQLEANFEVVLEGAFAITVIEAFPYANTRADFSWIAGGPGTNSVKLKLKGRENEGFSYTVRVWGVPLKSP